MSNDNGVDLTDLRGVGAEDGDESDAPSSGSEALREDVERSAVESSGDESSSGTDFSSTGGSGSTSDSDSDSTRFVSFQPSFDNEELDEGRVLGSGDSRVEATAEAQLRTGRTDTGFTEGTDQRRVFSEQEDRLRSRRESVQETIDDIPDAERLSLRGTELEDELGGTADRDEVVSFFEEQDAKLESSVDQIESAASEFDRSQRPGQDDLNRFDAGNNFRQNVERGDFQQPDSFTIVDTVGSGEGAMTASGEDTRMFLGVEQPSGTQIEGTDFLDQRREIADQRGFIPDFVPEINTFGIDTVGGEGDRQEDVDVDLSESSLGTRALAGGAAAFNPEISTQVLGRSAQDLTPFELPFDTGGSTQEIVEEDIERQITEDESITDNISPLSEGGMALSAGPIGRLGAAGVQGARAIGPRTGAAAMGTLGASGIGLTAAEVDQIIEASDEGRGDEALGRSIGVGAGITGTAGGAARGFRDFAPQLGRTAEMDTTARGVPTDDQRIIGEGDAEGTVNVLRNRLLLPGRSQRDADIEGDFRFDADEGGTISEGEFEIDGPDGFPNTGFDFETVSTPLTRQGRDTTVSRDLGRTETEGLLFRRSDDFDGVSRSTRVEDETLDSAQFVGEDAFLDTGEPVRRVESDSVARLQDGSETFGTQELFLPATRTGGQGRDIGLGTGTSGAGGGRGATDVDLSGVQQGFVQNIRQVNQDLARPGLGESGLAATTGGGSTSGGAQADIRPLGSQEAQEFEAELDGIETQQERQTQELGVQNSPLMDTEELARGTVTDRLTREAEVQQGTQEFGELGGQGAEQIIDRSFSREPSVEPGRPQTEVRPVSDIGPTITRGTTFETTPGLGSPFGELDSDRQQGQGLQRPLADDALGVTRRELPDTRIRQEESLIPGLGLGSSTATTQRTESRSRGLGTGFAPRTGIGGGGLGIGLGFGSETQTFDADPFFGGETEEEFAPDFGTAVGLFEEEDAATEEDDLTGLERRGGTSLGGSGMF